MRAAVTADLRSRFSEQETEQLLASTRAVLTPAAAAERDRAAAWCIRNAPPRG